MDGVSLARAALKAALTFYEETGSISLPLYISNKSEKNSPQTVNAGTTQTVVSPSNIIPLQKQSIAAEDQSDTSNIPPAQRVRYPSGQKKRKGN